MIFMSLDHMMRFFDLRELTKTHGDCYVDAFLFIIAGCDALWAIADKILVYNDTRPHGLYFNTTEEGIFFFTEDNQLEVKPSAIESLGRRYWAVFQRGWHLYSDHHPDIATIDLLFALEADPDSLALVCRAEQVFVNGGIQFKHYNYRSIE